MNKNMGLEMGLAWYILFLHEITWEICKYVDRNLYRYICIYAYILSLYIYTYAWEYTLIYKDIPRD